MALSSLASRLVASAAIWCALLLSAGGYGLSALFSDVVEDGFDARLKVLLEGIVAGSDLNEDNRLDLRLQLGEPRFDQPFSGWYWQINDGDQPIRRSASLWVQNLDVAPPAEEGDQSRDIIGPGGKEVRLLRRWITLPGRDLPFVYIVAGDLSEVSQQKQRFNRLLSLSLGVLFLGVLAAILIQVRFGLEPLRRIGRALAAIRSGESRRLEGVYPSEIQPLAVELNALIKHSETLIERAQTHVGNLAHALKTPLSILANEADRLEGPPGDLVTRQANVMQRQIDHHLARARAAATSTILGARTEVAPVIADLQRTLKRLYAERAVIVTTACPPDLVFRGARHDLEEMLGNLMDNACKWSHGQVKVTCVSKGETLEIMVEDDGTGLPASRRSEVLQRGKRLDETVPGSGLGLSIVSDLATLYGGTLALGDADLGGLKADLVLPAAASIRSKRSMNVR